MHRIFIALIAAMLGTYSLLCEAAPSYRMHHPYKRMLNRPSLKILSSGEVRRILDPTKLSGIHSHWRSTYQPVSRKQVLSIYSITGVSKEELLRLWTEHPMPKEPTLQLVSFDKTHVQFRVVQQLGAYQSHQISYVHLLGQTKRSADIDKIFHLQAACKRFSYTYWDIGYGVPYSLMIRILGKPSHIKQRPTEHLTSYYFSKHKHMVHMRYHQVYFLEKVKKGKAPRGFRQLDR